MNGKPSSPKGNLMAALGSLVIFVAQDLSIYETKGSFWTGFLPIAFVGAVALLGWIGFATRKFTAKDKEENHG